MKRSEPRNLDYGLMEVWLQNGKPNNIPKIDIPYIKDAIKRTVKQERTLRYILSVYLAAIKKEKK